MPKGVNYPLFIPTSCSDVAQLIQSRLSDAAVELLWKKVRDGNHEAAALLAYIHLRGAAPKEDCSAAFRECKAAAEAGEPYAELVTAQLFQSAKSYPDSIKWLQRACDQRFPPALAQMGRLMTFGTGFPSPDRAGGLRMYWEALKRGHVPTLIFVAKNLFLSRNPVVWPAGVLVSLLGIVAFFFSYHLAPFKLMNFVHISGEQPPLFQPKVRPS